MNKDLFLKGLRMINYQLASGNGNVVKRISSVAFRILQLHGDFLNEEIQVKLKEIQQFILDRTDLARAPINQELTIHDLKKEQATTIVKQLLEIEFILEDKAS